MVRSMSCCVVDGLQYMAGGTKSRMIPCPASEEALKSLLELSGVDTSQFGIGKAKPLMSLLAELREGSCRLEYDRKTKKVCRCVEPVYVQVCYDGKLLVEREHILPNGNQRQRNSVLAEKREPDDASPVAAALRGITEELHVFVTADEEGGVLHCQEEDCSFIETMDSASYPGIPAVYETHHIRFDIVQGGKAELDLADFCKVPAGQAFKTEESKLEGTLQTFWEWMDLEEARKAGIKGLKVEDKPNIRIIKLPARAGGA